MRLLAVGTSVRHVAQSASRFADVVTIDEFRDLDTRRYAERSVEVEEVTPGTVAAAADALQFDAAVTTSPNVPPDLPLLGNSVEEMRRVGDKLRFARFCEERGYPHPETRREPSPETPLAKPRRGGGGRFNRVAGSGEVPEELRREAGELVYQELVEGEVVSVSLLSDGSRAETVSINRSLSGVDACRPPARFVYCGNVTPYAGPGGREAAALAEHLVEDLGLRGSVGVDMVLTDGGPVALEVNPRLQASLDTVEAAHGVDVVERQVAAARGEPGWGEDLSPFDPGGAACRLVLYAPRDLEAPELSTEGLRDVPPPGRRVEKGEPVCSVLRTGGTAGGAMSAAREAAERVYGETGDDS